MFQKFPNNAFNNLRILLNLTKTKKVSGAEIWDFVLLQSRTSCWTRWDPVCLAESAVDHVDLVVQTSVVAMRSRRAAVCPLSAYRSPKLRTKQDGSKSPR